MTQQNEPTQEQIQEFWEWCGFKFILSYPDTEWRLYKVIYPDGHYNSPAYLIEELPIDLNNLFNWAVPKLAEHLTVV